MRYEAGKNKETGKLRLFVNGVHEPCAFAFDAEEGYYERWVLDPDRPGKIKLNKSLKDLAPGEYGIMLKEKIYGPFTVVDRVTGDLFAESAAK